MAEVLKQIQCAIPFQVSDCIMPANIPLAKTGHMVEPSVMGGAGHLSMVRGQSYKAKGMDIGRGENLGSSLQSTTGGF